MIVLHHVSKVYANGATALTDVSLEIPDRDFVFLVGPSGAGKSTFIRLLIREELPTSGRVFVEGQDIARLRNGAVPYLRRKVSVIFQDFRLLPEMTVFENVAFALRVAGYKRKQIDERVTETLELVKMDNYRDRFPYQLSGGEQQRVAIARAIVHKPPVLVADEPTGNLDPDTAAETVQLLVRINALGTTLLMATHNRDLVDTMQRRVVALEAGRIVRDEQRAGYV
ncbi:MAG: cell division ATP-binding protein FtsE [Rhodospirillaceae bacterium]|nr:cell division ATP-binding protein FtsE [Rhodospirillaceae bacterium]